MQVNEKKEVKGVLTEKKRKEYYRALLDKNKAYEGVFFVGVKTTGVFCRMPEQEEWELL